MKSRKTKHASLTAIILAAGEGTRMKSNGAKVLHKLGGRTLLAWVLEIARAAGAENRVVVLGHRAGEVRPTLPKDVRVALQSQRLGTGHAVKMAKAAVAEKTGDVLVLCGDAPLIRPTTLQRLVRQHRKQGAQATVLTAKVADPFGYGRIVRDGKNPGCLAGIVEERDATPAERLINEVNSGAYCFSLPALWKALEQVRNLNKKSEYYLTDVVALLHRRGGVVSALCAEDAVETLGVNTRQELVRAAQVLNRRKLSELMDNGVTIWEPEQTWVEPQVKIGRDTELLPGTILSGQTILGPNNVIGPYARLDSCKTGNQVKVCHSVVEGAVLAAGVSIGPYSHIRPGVVLDQGVHIGNFAEVNRSHLQAGVKMGHFSYLGDAQVGQNTNIGAGTITANYDGVKKNATQVGERAFIGSGTILIAPCVVGARALTGAGSVVKSGTKLPPDSVAVGVPARVIKRRS